MEFLFENLTRKLTSERSEPVRCRVEHEERNSISTSNHVLFCLSYNHNSPLLGRKADFINKWIKVNRQSSNNNRRVRWRWPLRWKNALSHEYENNNGCNFQVKKLSFIDFVLTDRGSLSGKRPKSAGGKSSSCQFSFSAERNANTKATEYATFGFPFSILVFFPLQESLNLIVCQRYGFL